MAVTTSLHKFTVEEGFVNNVSSMQMLCVGIDARCVLYPILHGCQRKVAGFSVCATCMG